MYLSNYYYLFLLLILPFLGGVIFYFIKWKRDSKNKFSDIRFREKIFRKEGFFMKFIPFLYLVAFLFLIFSIIDLLGGKEKIETQQKVSNVIFLLDV